MTNNGSSDRLAQLQTLLADFIAASVADRQAINERFRQIEEARERDRQASHERMTRLEQSMEQFQALVETSYEPVQALLEASTRHEETIVNQEATIGRLDAILERMVYWEGRGNGDE